MDFGDQGMFKPESIITLIHDVNAPADPTIITYEEIKDKVKDDRQTSHLKTG